MPYDFVKKLRESRGRSEKTEVDAEGRLIIRRGSRTGCSRTTGTCTIRPSAPWPRMPVGGRAADDGGHSPRRQGPERRGPGRAGGKLRAIAGHHALPIYDLSDSSTGYDPASLEIAAWDDHPNALGHRRLFLALARSLVKDEARYHLLFPESPASQGATRKPVVEVEKTGLDHSGAEAASKPE